MSSANLVPQRCLYASRAAARLGGLSRTKQRAFSTTNSHSLNPLFNLSGLAISKEAQYLSKERKVPREEYSSNYQLIRSSEVDPFAPAPGTSPTVIAALKRAQRGESDMQTAYSLAISNLLAQLEASRAEAKQSIVALRTLQEKHKSQERHALVIILGCVTFFSVTFFKPDALDMLGREVTDLRNKWHAFDWQWLGNPPTYRMTGATTGTSTRESLPYTDAEAMVKVAPPMKNFDMVVSDSERSPDQDTQYHAKISRSSWTRLFWAAPSEQ